MRILHRPDLPPLSQGLQSWADVAMARGVELGRVEVARSLMMELKALGPRFDSSLLYAPLRDGNDAMALFLIREAQVDVDSPTCEGGITPLMLAANKGVLEVVRCLVKERGVDVHAKDKGGRDVALYCAGGGHVEVIRFLVEEVGMDVSDKRVGMLYLAAKHDRLELVKWLVLEQGVEVTAKSQCGYNALHCAVGGGALRTFQWLPSSQPSVEFMLEALSIGLWLACGYGRLEFVKWLVEEIGMPASVTNENGRTLLDMASSSGHTALVEYLRKAAIARKREEVSRPVSRVIRGEGWVVSLNRRGQALLKQWYDRCILLS